MPLIGGRISILTPSSKMQLFTYSCNVGVLGGVFFYPSLLRIVYSEYPSNIFSLSLLATIWYQQAISLIYSTRCNHCHLGV